MVISALYEYLQDPQHVVRFQRMCGLVPAVGADTNGEEDHSCLKNGHQNGQSKHVEEIANGSHATETKAKLRKVVKESVQDWKEGDPVHSRMPTQAESQRTLKHHVVKNKFFYYLFNFGTSLGDEIFYLIFFPLVFWNFDYEMGRKLYVFVAVFMYLGQASKDIICLPRPKSPPVIRMDGRYELEFGMPSTHAMIGTGIPFTILFMAVGRYEFSFPVGLALAVSWTTLVCCSRIYLGMHSLLDLLVGIMAIAVMLPLYLLIADDLDQFILYHPLSPFACLLVPLIMCLCYPSLSTWSTARGDTSIVLAGCAGQCLANWFNAAYGYCTESTSLPPFQVLTPTWSFAVLCVLRMFTGLTALLVLRGLIKLCVFKVICYFKGLSIDNVRSLRLLSVELPYMYITYSTIGALLVFAVPQVHKYLGIHHEAYFTGL